ncbi:MAG: hypothetical protein JXN59_16845, partial [Anaerolineae bacterium]|nr:hypothetical protein [Anaerolineae bacterium]
WRETFGEIADLETLARATQFLQASGLRYAVEANRRRKYQNSGSLPWQFNEPYPNATCTSAVDYFGQPKPVYYAVAQAYEPAHVSAAFATFAWGGRPAFEADIWVNNSRATAIEGGLLAARIISADGRVLAGWTAEATIGPDSAAKLLAIRHPLLTDLNTPVFFLDLSLQDAEGASLSGSRYAFTTAQDLAPLLAVPPTRLSLARRAQPEGWRVAITNSGSQAALGIWLEDGRPAGAEGFASFTTNAIFLLPGEQATVMARWHAVPEVQRRLVVSAWNAPEEALL